MAIRVFLDANVLFSAAHRLGAQVNALWLLPDVQLMTSPYAIDEALRNLDTIERRRRLRFRLSRVIVVRAWGYRPLPVGVVLPRKDQPIMVAAIAAQALCLLTGDKRHFGPYYGKRIGGVLVIPPAQFLLSRRPPV